jgi:hypothetical protein
MLLLLLLVVLPQVLLSLPTITPAQPRCHWSPLMPLLLSRPLLLLLPAFITAKQNI